MQPLLQLNLQNDSEKAEPANLPKPESKEPEVVHKKLNQMAKKASRRAATDYSRNSSGIFSK